MHPPLLRIMLAAVMGAMLRLRSMPSGVVHIRQPHKPLSRVAIGREYRNLTFREYLPQCAIVYIMKHTVKVNNDGLYKVKEDNCCVFLDK